jgi:AmmeMemoRadiSam system protein A
MSMTGTLASDKQRRALLNVARETAAQAIGVTKESPAPPSRIEGTHGGAFVTFWRGKLLRGCMGQFAVTDDIVKMVEDVTRSSLADPRFLSNRIDGAELAGLNIEVSVLSDLEPTDDPASLIPGTHGIVVRGKRRSGCFLPKVASERGWSAEEFLSNCCGMKAGLPADAWRSSDTKVLLFTADVFAESDFA